jgi:hypothetical protein
MCFGLVHNPEYAHIQQQGYNMPRREFNVIDRDCPCFWCAPEPDPSDIEKHFTLS